MTFKRRRQSTRDTDHVVSTYDPAIDVKRSDIEKYLETMDLGKIATKPGERCCEFVIRPLSRPQLRTIRRDAIVLCTKEDGFDVAWGAWIETQQELAFYRSCSEVRNLMCEEDDGSFVAKSVSTEEAGEALPANVINQIGRFAIKMSTLEPPKDDSHDVGKP